MSKKIYSRSLLLFLVCILSSCSSNIDTGKGVSLPQLGGQKTADFSPDISEQRDHENTKEDEAKTRNPVYFPASENRINNVASTLPNYEVRSGDYTLNFRDSDIKAVIAAVLGDMLNLAFQIDNSVSGTLTLQTSSPITKEALLPTLETVLRVENYSIVVDQGIYKIVPSASAPSRVSDITVRTPQTRTVPGFSIQIVPLRFIHANEIAQILQPFAPPSGIVRIDDARSLIILGGTSSEISLMLQVIDIFDVNWLEGMNFALFPISYAELSELAGELRQIFESAESPTAGTVNFVPIPRLNSILAFSHEKTLLNQVETWISRLDRQGESAGKQVYVYHVQNGHASDLAQILRGVLGTGQTQFNNRSQNQGDNPGSFQNDQTPADFSNNSFNNTSNENDLRIIPDESNNALIFWASSSEYRIISSALKQLDISPRQVLIEASLVEVTLTDELRYGVQWFFESGDNTVTFSDAGSGAVSSQFPGLSYVYSGASDGRAVLNAIASITDVKVISSPKLMVLNNHSATIQVGDQVPVATQSAVSSSDSNAPIINTVSFRDTGVILTVTPRINSNGFVQLEIEQEVSDVVATTTSGIDSPTIQQRKIMSNVAVRDGYTIALGGLIRESLSNNNAGIPLLKDIPMIGNLFRSNDMSQRRTELIILITPRVARDLDEMDGIVDYLRSEFQNILSIQN